MGAEVCVALPAPICQSWGQLCVKLIQRANAIGLEAEYLYLDVFTATRLSFSEEEQ